MRNLIGFACPIERAWQLVARLASGDCMSQVRLFGLGLVLALTSSSAVFAQDWGRKIFDETSHDFGRVARGSKSEFSFKIHNPFKETVHISDVRSSCGCTTPRIVKDTLATYEESAIIATFNTRTFLGQRHATLTVVIDKPLYTEVQLEISGYIRRDIVIHPGEVALGKVDQGAATEKRISISYAGRNDWAITDVKSGSSYLQTQLIETQRSTGLVSYDLVVKLTPDAPSGPFNEQLMLLTNDQRSPEVPLDVEGEVVADLTVSPPSLLMGVLAPGQKSTKQLVIKAKQPFRITGVECDETCFEIHVPDTSKPMHVLPITFVAGSKPGKVSHKIRLRTDLGQDIVAEFSAFAQVVVPERTVSADVVDTSAAAK